MGAHGHGDADGAEHQRDQTHQREQAGGAIEPLGERGVGLAVVDDLRLGQELFEPRLEVGDGFVGDGRAIAGLGHFEEIPLPGVASGCEQAAGIKAFTRDAVRVGRLRSCRTDGPAR